MNSKLRLSFEELLAVTVSLEIHKDSKPHLWNDGCESGLQKLKQMRYKAYDGQPYHLKFDREPDEKIS